MPVLEGAHADLLQEAIAAEARAHRALLAGAPADDALNAAAALYRASWEAAPPRSYGRLIGMLKASVIVGDAGEAAHYARAALGTEAGPRARDEAGTRAGTPAAAGAEGPSPPASYALAIAALVDGDDDVAAQAAAGMRGGSPAMVRTAGAIAALAAADRVAYGDAVRAIVADFERRDEHLTGVPIADTALMLERLAAARGMACGVTSPLLPPPRGEH
jgi:hypothetical protein